MAVMESTGGVDLGVKVGSTSGRNLEPHLRTRFRNRTARQGVRSPAVAFSSVSTDGAAHSASAAAETGGDGAYGRHKSVPGWHPTRETALRSDSVQREGPQHRFLPLGQAVDHVPSDAAGTGTQGVQGNGAMAAAARSNSCGVGRDGDVPGEGFRKDIRDLEELLSKLNRWPKSLCHLLWLLIADLTLKKSNYSQGKRRMNSRTSMAQREEIIRRTVYVSDIDQQVTEEQLAALFITCGQVVDCRVCGDPNSVLRFAFIEFTDEEGAGAALSLSGTMLGYYPVRVLPSKTAIAPVNPAFLPRSEVEREMCARTVYCTNIDKKVSQAGVKLFFESICGEVHRLRLLGDYHHSTRIAFVEFVMAESAIAALNCSGAVLGEPIKDPVRSRAPRPSVR
ncbi:unnamed protein product [Spirodela intermedia]|uniref:RRM domain-containing protein n=1 Tax=Spirodela intermedia TaxID=51605 RepID=A0A7I8JTH6_SPIIN|nr:unnamed protein product [Spirodela intermedia]CAA6673480.1 unnamed protein product [Spirodela intermedia]